MAWEIGLLRERWRFHGKTGKLHSTFNLERISIFERLRTGWLAVLHDNPQKSGNKNKSAISSLFPFNILCGVCVLFQRARGLLNGPTYRTVEQDHLGGSSPTLGTLSLHKRPWRLQTLHEQRLTSWQEHKPALRLLHTSFVFSLQL